MYVLTIAPTTVSGDALYYHYGANALADGAGYSDPYRWYWDVREEIPLADGTVHVEETAAGTREPTAAHPPAFVTYLGAFSAIGLTSERAHQLATVLLGTATIVLAGLVGRSLAGERVGLLAAAITAVYANIWISDGLVMSESMSILLTFATTWAALVFWRRPTIRTAIIFGAVGGLAALARAELVLYVPLVAVVAVLRAAIPWRFRIREALLTVLVFGVVLAPWVGRNMVVFRSSATLTATSWSMLAQANCDQTYHAPILGYWSLDCSPWPHGPNGERLDEAERDAAQKQRATDYIRANTGRLVTVVAPARVLRMWGAYQPAETVRLEITEGRPASVMWLGFWQYWVLLALAIVGAIAQWRARRPVFVVAAWALLSVITAVTAYGSIRLRSSAEVAIVLFAAIAIDRGIELVRRRHGSVDTTDGETAPSVPVSGC